MQSTYCTSIPAREGWGKERERNVISRALSAWSPQRGSREKNVHDHRRERQSACCAQTATRAQAKGETDLGWIPSELHIIQGCLYALAGR